MRLARGTACLDLSDVDAERRRIAARVAEVEAAAIANEIYLQRQLRAALDQKQVAYARGYQQALEDVGADITITDGIPQEIIR